MSAGEYVDVTEPLGTAPIPATVQCCYLDGCIGNLSCTVPGIGNEPCLCNPAYHVTLNFNYCGVSTGDLCN
jgi:hypothetical protein